jgi:hypothetical protein
VFAGIAGRAAVTRFAWHAPRCARAAMNDPCELASNRVESRRLMVDRNPKRFDKQRWRKETRNDGVGASAT